MFQLVTLWSMCKESVSSKQFLQSKRQRTRSRKQIVTLSKPQGDKYATPDSTPGLIGDGPLRPDHRRLCMLCWPARASDVLIDLLLFNGYEHSLNSPLCSCVSITLPGRGRTSYTCITAATVIISDRRRKRGWIAGGLDSGRGLATHRVIRTRAGCPEEA